MPIHARIITFVNGLPRAGKDTAIASLLRHWSRRQNLAPSEQQPYAAAYSSIDGVRDLLTTAAGLHLTRKTAADRLLLQQVGAALESHSGFRTRPLLEAAKLAELYDRDVLLIFQVREPELIDKIVRQLHDDWRFARILVTSTRPEVVLCGSNPADAVQTEIAYDWELQNNSTTDVLERTIAEAVVPWLLSRSGYSAS